jgi:uncharacterized membrane protein (UPF0127 family)
LSILSLIPRKFVVQLCASVLTIVLTLSLACGRDGPTAVVHGTERAPVSVQLEVANTPADRERGLMYRRSLPENGGMLFIFPEETDLSFWMKNTLIPLDMLFIARDGRIVGIHPDAVPLSLAPISVGAPSAYVLEVNGGWAARHGVRAGDQVELHGLPASP